MAGIQASGVSGCSRIPASAASKLKACSAAFNVPPTVVLLAAFTALMHRYTGNETVCVRTRMQTTSTPRRHAAPLWSRDPDNHSFADHLRATHQALAEADTLPDTADLADLFTPAQVPCSFGPPTSRGVVHGLDVAVEPVAEGSCTDAAAGWTLHWFCDDSALSTTAFERMIGHYDVLLEAALTRPNAPLCELPMLTTAELRQLATWTATEVDYPEHTVIDLLERCAARNPHSSAVTGPDGTLTYEELAGRVNRLAGQLRDAGMTPGAPAGVLMQRSPGMYVAALAIMKAGGAYLPLDPQHPPHRIATVLDDASASLMITDEHSATHLKGHQATVVQVDVHGSADTPTFGPSRAEKPTADDLAYVIYTSGTTGRPKGIPVPHRALTNLLMHFDSELGLREGDTVGGVTTTAFDMSILEFFLPLVRGACLAVLPRATVTDGVALCGALTEYSVSLMQATPATWRMLIDAGWQGHDRFTAACGGETTPPDLAEELRRRVGAAWNLYGPSETTVWSTSHRIKDTSGPIPVGRPIANTVLRILDRHAQLVPVGVPGELYIGGAGVASGYLGRPDLTAERFVVDPHSSQRQMLYRTGDLARWSEDGELEFLGRIDRQVKVRGYRIELEEIEAVLNRHPRVRHGVVDVRATKAGEQQLVGYVVPASPDKPGLQEITSSLCDVLPDYMVPRPLITIPQLPLSPNGKVLRSQLPAPQEARTAPAEHSYDSAFEERLATIWADVLALETVLPDDDFFDLGGTSLLAQRVAARIQEEFHLRLRMSALMRHPTVPALARFLQNRRAHLG